MDDKVTNLRPPVETHPGPCRFDFLDMQRDDVQDFVWAHLNPHDFHHNYTKFDAMKEVMARTADRRSSIYGDLQRGIAVRCDFPAPRVVSPHLMGNAVYVRGLMRVGLSTMFAMGMTHVNISTRFKSLIVVLESFGFELVGTVPGMTTDENGATVPVFIISLSRDKYFQEA